VSIPPSFFSIDLISYYTIFLSKIKISLVRCPGKAAHLIRYGYQEYVDHLVELAVSRKIKKGRK
jgi:hypothetical protein